MQKQLINGEFVGNKPNKFPIINPANGEIVDITEEGNINDVSNAVAAALAAFLNDNWKDNASLRSYALYKWSNQIEEKIGELAILLTKENGKLLSESIIELKSAVNSIRFAAGQARTLEGRALNLGSNVDVQIIMEPIGVIAIITPWNWPVLLMIRELAPALAAGNTVVVKPSSYAPLTCMKILELTLLIKEIPKGTINAVLGGGNIVGNSLVDNDSVKMISFTGSTNVGKKIGRLIAKGIKKAVLELGGKSPSIIFKDAEIEKAIPALVRFMFITAGQNCMAATRILVQDKIFDEVRDKIITLASKIKVGSGLKPTSNMGPVISEERLTNIDSMVKEGISSGGELLIGGHRLTKNDLGKGYFYSPTIFAQLPIKSPLVQNEIFGPVISIETFHDEDEAIYKSNATSYGLVASIWTTNHNRAKWLAHQIQAGTIWINTYMLTFPEVESGGMKKSGIGRSRGKAGIYEFMEIKSIISEF